MLGSSSGSSFDDFGCVHLSRLQLVVLWAAQTGPQFVLKFLAAPSLSLDE